MRLLLDTHIALWAIADRAKLSAKAHDLIADPDNIICISVASIWEIAIKNALGRRALPMTGAEALEVFDEAGYTVLAISSSHALAVEQLPALHSDPFDRMLVAQATTEPCLLLTRDRKLTAYGDMILRV